MTEASIPIGGSTGLCHESTPAIDECARYLASVPPEARPRPLVPAMREMFGLKPIDVCAAIRQSKDIARAA